MRRNFRLLPMPALALALLAAAPAGVPVATAPAVPVTPVSPSEPGAEAAPPEAWLARPVAELQGLDKIIARVTPLTIRVGQSVSFGSLSIFVRACLVRPPDQVADTAMFVDITDEHPNAPQFHGWMIVSAPGAAMLEHPVYDIRPAACHA